MVYTRFSDIRNESSTDNCTNSENCNSTSVSEVYLEIFLSIALLPSFALLQLILYLLDRFVGLMEEAIKLKLSPQGLETGRTKFKATGIQRRDRLYIYVQSLVNH